MASSLVEPSALVAGADEADEMLWRQLLTRLGHGRQGRVLLILRRTERPG